MSGHARGKKGIRGGSVKRLREEDVNGAVLSEVVEAVRNGGVVVFKTDTVYGLGANAHDAEACERIYEIKGRPAYKPLCVLVSDMEMLEGLVEDIGEVERKLMKEFWPGSLTIKMRKKTGVLPDIVSAGDEFVRVRLLKDGFARRFVKALGVPVVAPSANITGNATGVHVEEVVRELGSKVDFLLDGGDIDNSVASTIVEVKPDVVEIIREGRIRRAKIEAVTGSRVEMGLTF